MNTKTPRFEVRPIIGQRLPASATRKRRAAVPRHVVKVIDTQSQSRRGLAYGSLEAMIEIAADLNSSL